MESGSIIRTLSAVDAARPLPYLIGDRIIVRDRIKRKESPMKIARLVMRELKLAKENK